MNKKNRTGHSDGRQGMGEDSTPEQSPILGNPRKRKRQDPVNQYYFIFFLNFQL